MSRLRVLGVGLLAVAVVVAGSACSKDEKKEASSDRGVITFSDAPEGSTDLGLCYAYDINQMKEIVGGDETFKRLAPSAIGAEGDAVKGEACAWERTEANGDSLSLRVEVRNFGDDAAGLASLYGELQSGTLGADPVPDVGDAAFASVTDETSLLQVRSGPYLLTLASRATGQLEPVGLDALVLLAAAGLDQLP